MKCVICHGEEVQVREVKEELNQGNDIVYVNIQTLVCQTCGERYYDRQTLRRLEETERKLKEGAANLTKVGSVYELAQG